MFLRPPADFEVPRRRRPRRRRHDAPGTNASITTHFPVTHVTRARAHNGDIETLPPDVIGLIVTKMLKKPADGTFCEFGHLKARQLSRTFRDETERQVSALLVALRTPLVALRDAFEANIAQVDLPDKSMTYEYNNAVRAHERAFRSPAYYKYKHLVRRLLHPVAAKTVLRDWARVAQWTDKLELVAWSSNQCLGCKCHIEPSSTKRRRNGVDLWHTALCDGCGIDNLAGMAWYDWSERPIQDEFLAIRELTGVSTQRAWMRYVPGIPTEAVFAHGVAVDRERVAEMVAAVAFDRNALAEAAEAERRARVAERRARRDERELRRRVAVFSLYEFRLSRCVNYTTPNFAMDIDRAHEALREAGLEQYRHTADELATLTSQDIDRTVVSFGRALKQLRCVQPGICGASTVALLADADAHLARTAPHLTRLDVYMAERRLYLPSALPVYTITAYKRGTQYDQWTTTAEAERLLAIFKANVERACHAGGKAPAK